MSESLNTDAHAREHCAVSAGTLEVLGAELDRQVLVRRGALGVALYTVTALVTEPQAVHAGPRGLARLQDGGSPSPGCDVTLTSDFTGGDAQQPARLTEQLLGDDGTTLAVLAPHGGSIEAGTDEQAKLVHTTLAGTGRGIRAWIARGTKAGGGAHACWHITSSEISEHSFPKLGILFGAPFEHAVAFHGNDDSEAIVVGGGLPRDEDQTALKSMLAERIREALAAIGSDREVIVRTSGELAGVLSRNVVNRITTRGNGIQLEQPLAVRLDDAQRDAVARAVAAHYADLVQP